MTVYGQSLWGNEPVTIINRKNLKQYQDEVIQNEKSRSEIYENSVILCSPGSSVGRALGF